MNRDPNAIVYRFHLAAGGCHQVRLEFDADFTLKAPDQAPDWAGLGFHPCQDCPLSGQGVALCPMAHRLSAFIEGFDSHYSYERAVMEVETPRRSFVAEGALQQGMASLIGLVGATSGCPRLAFLKPMARFHLPFASEQETLVRIFAFHLLQCRVQDQACVLEDLNDLFAGATLVNRGMAERIRAAFVKDAVVNAIVILDAFAQAVPFVVEEKLAELAPIF